MIREQGQHLLLGLDVLLLGVAEALGVVYVRVGREADKAVVDRALLLADEMGVVGRYDLDAVLLSEGEDLLVVDHLLAVDVDNLFVGLRGKVLHLRLVEHHFEVIVVAEDSLVPADGLVEGFFVACDDGARNLSGNTRGGADKSFVVLLYHFVGHSRAVVHTLDVGDGDYLDEVAVAGQVFREKDKVVVAGLLPPVVTFGHVDLAAHDGLDRLVLAGVFEELLDAVHIAVIGQGNGGHSELFGSFEKVAHRGETVENRVLRVDVKVDEGHS